MHIITETLKKINVDLRGSVFLSIFISILILNIFLSFKIIEADNFNKSLKIDYFNTKNVK